MRDSTFRSFFRLHSEATAKSAKSRTSVEALVIETRLAASRGPSSPHRRTFPLKRFAKIRTARERCAIAPTWASLRSYRSARLEPASAIASEMAQLIKAVMTTATEYGHAKISAVSATNEPMRLALVAAVRVLPD